MVKSGSWASRQFRLTASGTVRQTGPAGLAHSGGRRKHAVEVSLIYYQRWVTASGEAPSEVGLLDPVGLLVMQPQTMHWTDNIIQLANYTFQVQTGQDQIPDTFVS